MKKQAVLIMAHHQFEILEKLLKMIDHECMDIYIHIDKKAKKFDIQKFSNICHRSHVEFVQRMNVYWGDSSQVECELAVIEAALSSGEQYSYLHLISGADLQLKKTEDILKFFDEHPNQQFLAPRNTVSGLGGLKRYHYFLPLRSYSRVLAKGLDMASAQVQKLMKVNRLKELSIPLCKTQQWFSITPEFASYVLTKKSFIRNLIRYTCCSDEMFLGTVLINSPFKEQWYPGHMRLIDRIRNEKASPHTWRMDDWDIIEKCPYFWARKFDLNKDAEVVDRVFETWG